ncbi:membrane dipeptidase [Nakamurella sp. YIM 132087]|uniref:Membrane dipeptidase n=1 Tax=Nakamurella alba TaxID=2665158 RepID=A0A7K1FK88_9ACTN|nr:dipeptidase [Nakamurella alba]MTD14551.1 membrane dipeptidase [Nakamurella alba]
MTDTDDRIRQLLDRAPVLDGHNDIAWALRNQVAYDLDRRDIAVLQPDLHTDIPRLRSGGVGAQFFSVFVPGTLDPGAAVIATLEQIDCVQRIIERYPAAFAVASTAAEVRAVIRSGRIAALMGAEGGHSIGGSIGVLRVLRSLGVGYMTLTHNQNVGWADAATDVPDCGGLSDLGREIVAEMNRINMLVDLSHVAVSTMHAALDVSRAPVIFSHSSCRALTDHVRDVPDEVLARLATNGGVQMITFVPAFVNQACADHDRAEDEFRDSLGIADHPVHGASAPDPEATAALDAWRAEHPAPRATLADVADHVEHARERAGVLHIGLGGDYDGTGDLPDGLGDVSRYPALLAELADRGWSDNDLAALTSGNILRVMEAAEHTATTP